MACRAILRRKFIPNNITISATASVRCIGGHFQSTRAFTTLTHKNHNSSIKNFNTRSPMFRYVSTNTFTPKETSTYDVNVLVRIIRTIQWAGHLWRSFLHMNSNDWAIFWCGCKIVYYTIIVKYQLGKELLFADVSITKNLLVKICEGKCLSRRERQLLARTTGDIFRLVPGSMPIVVHSTPFLLPVLLKLCPNILPSTFQDKISGQERVKRKLRARKEYAKFLQETATEMARVVQNSSGGQIKPMAEEFQRFWVDIRVCRPVSSEQIFRFAKLFSDELILDNVSSPVLADMCKSMGITPFGTDEYLRFILREKLKSIKNDDKLIQSKGVESLSEAEVRKACRERGIHAAEEMQQQLRDWLDLSLNHAVPSAFLIICRVFTATQKLKPEEAIIATLSSLPYELIYIVGMVCLPCNDPRIDKRRKIESLKLQEELIKEEEEKERSEMKQFNAIEDDVALEEMTISTPEQTRARAVDEHEQLCELITDATTVLTFLLNVSTECDKLSRLLNKEINLYSSYQGRKGPEGKDEAVMAYRAGQEDNEEVAGLYVGDNVSSALMNRANGMLQKLEKETDDVGAKISYRWRVLERYCDGKVSLDVVAAVAFLNEALDKKGIQELISNLSKYKEEIVKLDMGAEDINQGPNQVVGSATPPDY